MSKEEQHNAAMDNLFGQLTAPFTPSSPSEVARQDIPQDAEEDVSPADVKLSPAQRQYKEVNERVCTIISVELMNKVRYISRKENIPIREIFEFGLNCAISDYEERHNTVINVRKTKVKKGDVSKVFGKK